MSEGEDDLRQGKGGGAAELDVAILNELCLSLAARRTFA